MVRGLCSRSTYDLQVTLNGTAKLRANRYVWLARNQAHSGLGKLSPQLGACNSLLQTWAKEQKSRTMMVTPSQIQKLATFAPSGCA